MYEKVCRNNGIFSKFKFWCSLIIDIRMLTLKKYCHEYIICKNVGWEICGVYNTFILMALLSGEKVHTAYRASRKENGLKTLEMQRRMINRTENRRVSGKEQNVTARRELRRNGENQSFSHGLCLAVRLLTHGRHNEAESWGGTCGFFSDCLKVKMPGGF